MKYLIIILCLSSCMILKAEKIEITKISEGLKLKKVIGQTKTTTLYYSFNNEKRYCNVQIRYCGKLNNKYVFKIKETKDKNVSTFTAFLSNKEKIKIRFHIFRLKVLKDFFLFK